MGRWKTLSTHCLRGHEITPENRLKTGKNSPYGRCKACVTENDHEFNDRVKREALTHYGNEGRLQCCWADCGIVDIDMLSLDHVNNDGASHRRVNNSRGGKRIYAQLRRNGFPAGYQTLCMNHQYKKEMLRRRDGRI